MKIIVDANKCCGSGECIRICPEKALSLHDGLAVLNESRCDFDGICIPACPNSAISYEESEPGEQ